MAQRTYPSRINFQVRIDASMKECADEIAKYIGFSSIQQMVRIFIKKVAAGEVDIDFLEIDPAESKNRDMPKTLSGKQIQKIQSKLKKEFLDEALSVKYGLDE